MGMSIDKAILRIEHSWMSDDDKETADFIINTMRKYKQIEEIIKSWKDGTIEEKDSIYAFHEIMGVVEDGNDNN